MLWLGSLGYSTTETDIGWDGRDRENCTVFVAELPPQVQEDELKALFKDVSLQGSVRVVLTYLLTLTFLRLVWEHTGSQDHPIAQLVGCDSGVHGASKSCSLGQLKFDLTYCATCRIASQLGSQRTKSAFAARRLPSI